MYTAGDLRATYFWRYKEIARYNTAGFLNLKALVLVVWINILQNFLFFLSSVSGSHISLFSLQTAFAYMFLMSRGQPRKRLFFLSINNVLRKGALNNAFRTKSIAVILFRII